MRGGGRPSLHGGHRSNAGRWHNENERIYTYRLEWLTGRKSLLRNELIGPDWSDDVQVSLNPGPRLIMFALWLTLVCGAGVALIRGWDVLRGWSGGQGTDSVVWVLTASVGSVLLALGLTSGSSRCGSALVWREAAAGDRATRVQVGGLSRRHPSRRRIRCPRSGLVSKSRASYTAAHYKNLSCARRVS